FAIIRLLNNPAKEGRTSRFFGSHTGAAWIVLLMIFNVLWTLELYRGAKIALANEEGISYSGAFFSNWVASLLAPLGTSTLEILEFLGVLLHIGVILGFLLIVLHSKHLHIGMAPINVAFSRLPNGLGPLLP
ncbi:MAG: hypothetical protein VW239_03135, partial [Candidatus Nanopelagicales bacterium]